MRLRVQQVRGAAVSFICLLQLMLALERVLLILTVLYIDANGRVLLILTEGYVDAKQLRSWCDVAGSSPLSVIA